MLNLVFAITVALALNGGLVSLSHAEDAQKSSHIPIEAFAQLKTASGMQLSPDGTHLAFFVVHEGRQVIIIQPLQGKTAGVIPTGEGAEISWFRWINKTRLAVSYAYTSKRYLTTTRETRLYGFDLDGKNMINLIRPRKKQTIGTRLGTEKVPAQIQDKVVDWLPEDPDHILLSLDSDLDGNSEVRLIDVGSGHFSEVIRGNDGIQNYGTDQQNEIRLAWGYDRNSFQNRYKSSAKGYWRSISDTPWGGKGIDIVGFSPDPKIAYVSGYNERGRKAIFQINLETDEVLDPIFSHDQVDYDHIVKHPVTGKPVGVQYTIDQPKIIYFDDKLTRIQATVDHALPKTINRVVGLHEGKKLYLIHAMSDVDPGVYYLLDMKSKELQFIAETMPGITPKEMAPVQVVSYKNRIGVPIPGYLTLPKGRDTKNLPAIVLVHGGPHARDTQMFDYMVQFLANRGYAVLQSNFRGSEGFGKAFENAGRQQWGGRMQDDVTDSAQWLIAQGIADPKRICIAGASYGGYAAAMGLIKTPDCSVAASALAPC
ncbi:hypothetical protein CRD36_00685 [Paremcibacter congregatus]|uniref:Peptidase S9 prolyl oligopeptidase catalytic domain-containing protein n=1 Tax=Paremcibacter congregatus TaxID=2043170 RepID=A0A2G4YVT5_9PROT|nr:prolyl oligopeptidase family serine peptidase [Paremcibacter congregatus]PHZ86437.1 hypothetical protein CRD36_00685 [Paremcibacter congregatus]QDE28467.1 S9 family peptidase [Paremcibacter congregatus]